MDWTRLLQLNKESLADFHTHTCFCDGKNTPEEMVQGALAKGLVAMGFSGHSHMDFDEEMCMSEAGDAEYRSEVARLKEKYADQIEIYCGIERDIYDTKATARIPESGLDYSIGSVHFVKCYDPEWTGGGSAVKYMAIDDTPEIFEEAIEKYFGGDVYCLCEEYFDAVSRVIEETDADIIGHFDLVTKFNRGGEDGPGRYFDESNPRYVAAWRKAADALLKTGRLFEVNTGGMIRGYRNQQYPATPILEYLKEQGAQFVLSSDSHMAETFCNGFEKF